MEGLAQPLGHGLDLGHAGHRRQQDGELVTAEATDGVHVAQGRPEPRPHLAQQLVAVGVAEAVVDLLEAVEVDQQQGDLGPRPVGRGERLREAVPEQHPVGQPGQRVVRRPVAVAVGGGPESLGLPAHARRRRRDQAEEDQVEDGQADAQRDGHGADVVADRGGHRRVRQVQLDDAVRLRDAVVLQGHVDLEQQVRAVLAAGAVVGGVREARDHVALQRGAELPRRGGLADELGVLGVVEDRAVRAEDLQLDRVERGQRRAALPELLRGVVDGLLDVGQARCVEAGGQVGPAELRLDAQAHRHEGGVLGLLTCAVLDDGGQLRGEHDTDRDREQQAQHGEPGEQTGRPQPAERLHARSIGDNGRFLE